MSHMQIIKEKGKPAFVVIPHKEWLRIQEKLEDIADARAYDSAKATFEASGHRTYPVEIVDRILNGEHPVKVLREWRKMTQAKLAAKTGLAKAVISHIETGVRGGGIKTLGKIAAALDVPLEVLAPRDVEKS